MTTSNSELSLDERINQVISEATVSELSKWLLDDASKVDFSALDEKLRSKVKAKAKAEVKRKAVEAAQPAINLGKQAQDGLSKITNKARLLGLGATTRFQKWLEADGTVTEEVSADTSNTLEVTADTDGMILVKRIFDSYPNGVGEWLLVRRLKDRGYLDITATELVHEFKMSKYVKYNSRNGFISRSYGETD